MYVYMCVYEIHKSVRSNLSKIPQLNIKLINFQNLTLAKMSIE